MPPRKRKPQTLCIVQNEAIDECIFEEDNTRNEFRKWLFSKEHRNCIVIAQNFHSCDSYFQQFLHENGVVFDIIIRRAKILALNFPMLKNKFITFSVLYPRELLIFRKHLVSTNSQQVILSTDKKEKENYAGPINPSPFYYSDGMTPVEKERFLE